MCIIAIETTFETKANYFLSQFYFILQSILRLRPYELTRETK